MRRLAALLAADETQLLYSIVLHGRAEIALAPDEYSGLVMVLLRMLAFAPGSEPATRRRRRRVRRQRRRHRAAVAQAGASSGSVPARGDDASAARPTRPAGVDDRGEPATGVRRPALGIDAHPVRGDVPSGTDGRGRVAPGEAGMPAPPPAVVAGPATAVPTELGDRWADVVRRLAPPAASARWSASWRCRPQCVAIDDARDAARLAPARRARDAARRRRNASKLQAALAELLGRAVRLEVEAGAAEDTPAARDAAERARRQAEAEQIDPGRPARAGADGAVQDGAHRAGLGQDRFESTEPIQESDTMMKGQLAGLMKQAQAMQDNLKKAQDELATIEVEGQSGAGLVKVTMTCKHDVKRITIDPSLLGRRQGHARGPGRRRVQRRRAPRRGGEPGEDGQAHRRHAAAPGHEAAVLSGRARQSPPARARLLGRWLSRRSTRLVEALRRLPGVGVKSAQRMAFHLLQHDREGARRIAAALRRRSRNVRHCERCHTFTEARGVRHLRESGARRAPALRRRDAGRSGRARAHRQLSRPLLRADGPAQPARRRRARATSARASCSSAPATA